MADIAKIKRNVAKMVSMNAPESDIDSYISSQGVSIDDVRNYKEPQLNMDQQKTQNGGVLGGEFQNALSIDPNAKVVKEKEEPMPPIVYRVANKMANEGRTKPSLSEIITIGLAGAGAGSKDALESVGEGMAQGATLGGYGAGVDYATKALGRNDLSYSARKKDREDRYGGWETGIHTLSEIAGAIPTGKTIYKGVNAGLSAVPKYGSSLTNGVLAKTATGSLEGGIHGGFTNGKDGMINGAIIGGAIPLTIAGLGAGVKLAGKGAKQLLGLYTGTSPETVGQAYGAGKRGSKEFLRNMRGKENMQNVLDDVHAGMKELKDNATREYNTLKPEVFGDKTRLDPRPVKQAFNKIKEDLIYPAQKYERGGVTENTLKRVEKVLDDFMIDTPNHNAVGFDAYKQRVGEILQGIDYKNKDARKVAGGVYHAMKETIGKQAPKYYEMTSKYADAMDDIADLQKAFSLSGKASENTDTVLRKIQSVMRDGVNTNYGQRLASLNKLHNAQEIKDKVAGQFMKDILPKGMARTVAGGIGGAGLFTLNPATIPAVAASSPRLVGEVAYKAGQLATKSKSLSNILTELQKTGVLPYLATMKGE